MHPRTLMCIYKLSSGFILCTLIIMPFGTLHHLFSNKLTSNYVKIDVDQIHHPNKVQ